MCDAAMHEEANDAHPADSVERDGAVGANSVCLLFGGSLSIFSHKQDFSHRSCIVSLRLHFPSFFSLASWFVAVSRDFLPSSLPSILETSSRDHVKQTAQSRTNALPTITFSSSC